MSLLNSKTDNIQYRYIETRDESVYFKPYLFLRNIWDDIQNGVWILDLYTGSRYIVFTQKYSNIWGSAIIISYGLQDLDYVTLTHGNWKNGKIKVEYT